MRPWAVMPRLGRWFAEEQGSQAMKEQAKPEDVSQHSVISGQARWFDLGKGFGLVTPDQGGPDILLHCNVLRDFGQGTVADGSAIVVNVHRPRGAGRPSPSAQSSLLGRRPE